MSSRQLCSHSDSDGLSLPPTSRKGRGKKSNQPEMEQQQHQSQQWATVQISPLQNKPPRPASTQPTAGKSPTPATGEANRSTSTPSHDTTAMQLPPINTMPTPRPATP